MLTIRRLGFALLTVALLCSTTTIRAQMFPDCGSGGKPVDHTNSGTEFLLVFMQNEAADYFLGDPSNYQNVYVASLDDTAQVEITCKANGYTKKFTMLPRTNQTIKLPGLPSDFIVESEETPDSTVVRVKSNNPIVVYGMNHKLLSADAFLALPINVSNSASAYMIMSYPNSTVSPPYDAKNFHTSEFAVAAFNDNTVVSYTPTVITASGSGPGVTRTVTLNAGECIQVQADLSDLNGDLTGSVVTADGPIAVFGGHRRTEAEHNFTFGSGSDPISSSRDHLAEQLPPINAWGQSFIARNFLPRKQGDILRVLSSADNNVVTVNGAPWGAPFAKGEHRDMLIAYNTNDTLNIMTVETSKPSLVAMIAHTAPGNQGLGDPFLAIVPPLNQTYNDFTYEIATDAAYTEHHLVIVTESSGEGKIAVDASAPYPPQSYIQLPNKVGVFNPQTGQTTPKNFSVAVVDQAPGIHRIVSPNTPDNGFTILAYGFGNVDSYGYTAGGLFVPQTALWRDPGPVSAPHPGTKKQPSFTIRNIAGDAYVWLDSIRIEYTSNPQNIPVTATNVPMTSFGILSPYTTQRITLAPQTSPSVPITGVARFYHHTGSWFNLHPLEVDFTIEPGTSSSVSSGNDASATTLYPNPARTDATLEFTLGTSAKTTVRIFDALGRIVLVAAEETMSAGANDVRFDTHSLANGTYVYEISAPAAGISTRGQFVVVH